MKNFLSIGMLIMGIYVYNCISHQNSSISDSCKINHNVFETENQMCYPEDRSNYEIENLENEARG